MVQSILDYVFKYELIIENSHVSCFRYVMKYELITENIYSLLKRERRSSSFMSSSNTSPNHNKQPSRSEVKNIYYVREIPYNKYYNIDNL